MATAYANPIEPPAFFDADGTFDNEGYTQRCEAYEAATLDYIKTELGGKHRLAGKILRFPVADGHAAYMLWTTTKWIHLDEMDGWHADPALIRGMRSTDVIDQVERSERRAALFAEKS